MKQFRLLSLGQLLLLLLAALTVPGAIPVRAEAPAAPLAGTTTSVVLTTPSSSANPLAGFGRWTRSVSSGWYTSGYNDSAWSTSISAGWAGVWNTGNYIPEIGQWALGVDSGDLEYYHRNTFNITIPTGYAIQSGTLQAFCDDSCEVYINGNAVSAGTISASLLHAGSNLFAIHQKNSGWWGGLQYRLQVTLYQTDTTGPTITFTPSTSSWTNGSVSITATASDPSGVNGVSCRFGEIESWTIGGSVCTMSTPVNDTFYVYAVDAVGNTSAVYSYHVTNIDSTAPTMSYTLSPASTNGQNGWYISPVTLTLNASDASAGVDSIYYQIALLGGAPPAPIYTQVVGSSTSITIRQATTVKWYAIDKVTNQSTMRTLTINVDQNAPGVTITPPTATGNNGWYTSSVTVPVSAVDGNSTGPYKVASWDYRINNGAWTPLAGSSYAVSSTVTISTPGSNVLEVRAVDLAGNQKVASATISMDTTAPTVSESLLTPTGLNGWYVTSPIETDLIASDSASGVDAIYYRVNPYGSTTIDPTYTKVTASTYALAIANGSWKVDWYATDQAGNTSAVRTFYAKVDALKPVLSETIAPSPVASGWYTQPISIRVSTTDSPTVLPTQPAIQLEYQLNRSGWQAVTGPITISIDAVHELMVRATDDAGNQTVETLNLSVDTTAPSLALSLPITPKPGWFPKGLNLTANYADVTSKIASVQYRVNGGPWQTIASPISSTDISMNAEGTFTYEVQVTDRAGLTTTKSTTVNIDATIPALSETIPTPDGANSWYKAAPVSIGLNALDGGAEMGTIYYRMTSKGSAAGAYTSVSSGSKTLSIDNGYTTVDWYAQDLTGNTSPVRSFVVKVDALAPQVQGVVTPSTQVGGWYPQAISVAVNSTDTPVIPSLGESALVEYQLDDAAWETVDGAVSISTEGTHALNMRATDPAGNVATSSLNLKVDATNPTIAVNVPAADGANGWYITAPVPVPFTASDGVSGVAKTCYIVDGSAPVCDGSTPALSTSGEHALTWSVTDNAGNTLAHSETVKIDLTVPVLTTSLPAPEGQDGWFKHQPVAVSVSASDPESGVATEYQLNGGVWKYFTGDLPITQEGKNQVVIRATNGAGQVTTAKYDIKIDTTVPTPGDILPPGTPTDGNSWTGGGPEGTGLALPGEGGYPGDITLIRYRLLPDGQFSTVPPLLTKSGIYRLEVEMTDSAGNMSTYRVTICLDVDAPVITTNLTGTHNPVEGVVALTGTVKDPDSGLMTVEVTLDGGETWQPVSVGQYGTFQIDYDSTQANDGAHVDLQIRAVDAVGNIGIQTIGLDMMNSMFIYLPVVIR